MKSITSALDSHLQQDVTTLCSCWVVTRKDGTVLGFTDLDVAFTFGGVLMNANSGFFRSAITNSATSASDNLEVKGFLDADFISEEDLINGAYDYAQVEIFMVNWMDLSQGRLTVRTGWFGETTRWPSGLFTVELRGLLQLFNNQVGQLFQPECRAVFGDARCKVPVFATQRISNHAYKVGDIVVVPQASTTGISYASAALPILNAGFDKIAGQASEWKTLNCALSNEGSISHDGSFVLQPQDQSGHAYQDVVLAPTASQADITAGSATATFSVWQYQQAAGYQGQAQIVFFDVNGNQLTTLTTASAETTVGAWTQITATGAVPTTAVTARCQINFTRTGGVQSGQGVVPATVLFDDCAFSCDGTSFGSAVFAFPGFEIGTDNGSDLWSWGNTSGWSRKTFNAIMGPYSGFNYAVARVKTPLSSPFIAQQIALPIGVDGITAAAIDAGAFMIELNAFCSAESAGSGAQLEIAFIDGNGVFMATDGIPNLFSPVQNVTTPGTWANIDLTGAIPAGARTVEIRLHYVKTGINIPYATSAYDSVTARVYAAAVEEAGYGVFGGVEFQCVAVAASSPVIAATSAQLADQGVVVTTSPTYAVEGGIGTNADGAEQPEGFNANSAAAAAGGSGYGITAATTPTFTAALNATTVDGGVTWKCVNPRYAFLGTVTAAGDNANFDTNLTTQVDSLFTWGTVQWLTGPNKGALMDVRSSLAANGAFSLMLPMPFAPAVGDTFIGVAGCDKTRTTCATRYNNILNMRGEPDLPGTDQFFKVGSPG